MSDINIMRISKAFHSACGEPSLDDILFKQAVYIGYGPSAIKVLLAGLDENERNVKEMAELLNYPIDFEIVIDGGR